MSVEEQQESVGWRKWGTVVPEENPERFVTAHEALIINTLVKLQDASGIHRMFGRLKAQLALRETVNP